MLMELKEVAWTFSNVDLIGKNDNNIANKEVN